MNTIEFLQISAAVVPEREALVEVGGRGRRLTYAAMQEQVTRLANAIRGLGVEQGQKIAVMAQNSADFVLTYYAAAMLGVTLVPLNYRSKDEELTHMLNVSERACCSSRSVTASWPPASSRRWSTRRRW